jgi:UDP-3-O-[3-hydroxymyristoyl] glucosamine N-acyltransferase LpxD
VNSQRKPYSPRPIEPLSATQLAGAVEGVLSGPNRQVVGLCTLDDPAPDCVGFIKSTEFNDASGDAFQQAIWLVPNGLELGPSITSIKVGNPRRSFAVALENFFAVRVSPHIASSVEIDGAAEIGKHVSIGPFCSIGPHSSIGDGTIIRSNVTIGPGVRIGQNCLIKSSTVIGEEGFGIETDASGNNARIPHVGSVLIGDHVELGALCTVCSGTIRPTIIEDYVKTDDHVHIAHNCAIGRNTLITACAELSGSVKVGRDVWIGPNASIMNGLTIGDRAFIGLAAVVTRDCESGWIYAGSPARKLRLRDH